MPYENLTLQISIWLKEKEYWILEKMCKQIQKYGDEATIKSGMFASGECFAVFRDPRSVTYPVHYLDKGYKSGDFL